MFRSLLATLSLLAGLVLPVGGTLILSGCEENDGKAKQTTSKRYDPKLARDKTICLVTDHLDSNNESDKDHMVLSSREGWWTTSGRAPDCVVQVKNKGKTADGKEPGWHTVARGARQRFFLDADKHGKFRALDCGPRGYNITAGYGVFKVECLTNQQWGAKGKSCKEHHDCK